VFRAVLHGAVAEQARIDRMTDRALVARWPLASIDPTRWQVYDWRKRLRDGRLSLPEEVAEQPRFARLLVEAPEPPAAPGPAVRSCVDIEVCGIVIRAGVEADEAHLARVIRAARAASA
jgi:transposase